MKCLFCEFRGDLEPLKAHSAECREHPLWKNKSKIRVEVLREAVQRLWDRMHNEQYGHAKSAVALDIEALEDMASKESK